MVISTADTPLQSPMTTADRHPDRHQETCGDRPGVGAGD